ncbi:MAG: response regulator transcription factor, partial [Steroidobacteraceae bacterium]
HRFRRNPYTEWGRFMRSRWKKPVSIPSSVITRARRTGFYRDFMQPQDSHHALAFGFVEDNRYLGLISVFRPERRLNFDARDAAKLGLVVPIIQAVLERNLCKERLKERQWIARAINSTTTSDGIVVLDERMSVLYCNSLALTLIDKLKLPAEREASHAAFLPKLLNSHCQAFAAQTEPNEAAGDFRIDSRGLGYELAGRILRYTECDRGSAYVLSLRANTQTCSHTETMQKLGLSRREIDIVNAVGAGLTSQQIADQLFVSYHTVHTHLKTIYLKLNVHNRTGLLRQITSPMVTD